VEEPRKPDLGVLCDAVEQVLRLVAERLPETTPEFRDWNDRLLAEAFARGYRCLRSVCTLACNSHSEDAYVLTRSLVSLTLQYLWLAGVEDEGERLDRWRRLQLKWVKERATMGEELQDIGYLPVDGSAGDVQEFVAQFRAKAEEFERDCVRRMPSERDMAIRLDRDLKPTEPRFFELVYARIYRRPTSQVAHYGLGAAIRTTTEPGELGALELEHLDESDAADALGLALVTFAALADFSDAVLHHGLTKSIEKIVQEAHPTAMGPADEPNVP
jgi:hypothetical protein